MSKQNYAVCCYTCEHNGQETCKGCNTILNGENEPYENWQLREDLCQKDKQITELKQQLHDLPKKIVGEIKKELYDCGKTYLEDEPYIEICIVQGILDTILKKYGEQNGR